VESGVIKCFDSVTVSERLEPIPTYIAVQGLNGWNWGSTFNQYIGYQNLYEAPGCLDPRTGLACYEADILREKCAGSLPPPQPFGVDFSKVLSENIRLARQMANSIGALYDNPAVAFAVLNHWFVEMVRTGGPWDYKNIYGPQYENFGNWHFGVVGSAVFGSEWYIKLGAGAAQVMSDFANNILFTDKRIGHGSEEHTGTTYPTKITSAKDFHFR
jgi:hypothetical protein